jgi:50S ribosomal subunit-associated GTPase HflX
MVMVVVLVGAAKAGKTSLLSRLGGDNEQHMAQIVRFGGKHFLFFDSVDENISKSPFFYPPNLNLVIGCIDLAEPSKQEAEDYLLNQLVDIKKRRPSAEIILVGTKSDESAINNPLDSLEPDSLELIRTNLKIKNIEIHSTYLTSAKTGAGLEELKSRLIDINQEDHPLNISFSQQPTQPSRARLFHDHPIATGAALGACLVATLMLTAVLSLSLQGFAIGCVIIILGGLVGAISTDSPKPNFA